MLPAAEGMDSAGDMLAAAEGMDSAGDMLAAAGDSFDLGGSLVAGGKIVLRGRFGTVRGKPAAEGDILVDQRYMPGLLEGELNVCRLRNNRRKFQAV